MPNIVLILSDDQGWGDLSINGNENLETPALDAIGHEGAVFERFYVCPVCSPTRAEMLTGRYHPRGGVYSTSAGGERLDLDEVTIAQILQKNGYRTGAFGKWHNGMQYPYHPNGRGFEEFYGFCSGHWGNYFSPMLEHNGAIVKGDGFIVDDLTDRALEFMEENRDQPFFAYLPYNTPHSPMQVPEKFWKKFANAELAMKYSDPAREDELHTRAALAMCENIDWNVARVIRKLENLSLLENTIVIYLSDNGPNGWRWNGGMKGRKGSTDEGGVRSPLIMMWKDKIKPGTKISHIASAIDLLPTLTGLANIDYEGEKQIDGKDLSPLIFNPDTTWEDRLVFNHWNNRISVRSQQFLLDHENRLFDMSSDPGQKQDISSSLPDVANKLELEKEVWEALVLSEIPEKDLRPFLLGHPDFKYHQLPARDGNGHGNIVRSNRFPNCTYFKNWTSIEDSITWEVEVVESGDFNVTLYYTCPESDIGSTFDLIFKTDTLHGEIAEAHNPPETGMENDRHPRQESYVKDFKPLDLGTMYLEKGPGMLTMKATKIVGGQVMDVRLLMLERI
ncbi:MAG: arylsulfatase [Saprospiraceae bacterium]|nr:arylsulfatase [Saprospiraceae bacterium]